MSVVWMVVGLAGLGAVVAIIALWRRGDPKSDLGAVSDQWVAERALGQTQDSQR